ncbi:hypothetical protein EI94DRAFT_1725127 [Lactarius quietus]|nr:hypothetical protein EI94DRAFT_1725127 [Lactarius quietus]
MASLSKRLSVSSIHSRRSASPASIRFVAAPNSESEEWVRVWENTTAQALVEGPVVAVDGEIAVEDACDLLLSRGTSCLAVKSTDPEARYSGLFDFADVNAFLTFAATRHTYTPEHLQSHPRAGHVPVHLVSILVKSPAGSLESHLGMISDLHLLAYFNAFARASGATVPPLPGMQHSPTFLHYVSNPLGTLPLPSLNLQFEVVAVHSRKSVLDAMRMMSDLGVSSVAVVEEDSGILLSAISVTDIGQTVVPSQSNQILSMPVHQLVSQIKMPQGWTDGADKYPVYSVFPSSTLAYTVQKLLATNSHRLFVTSETPGSASPSACTRGNLSGVVSIGDILSLFARIANIPDVDPGRMRHRRASSTSSHGSSSGGFAEHMRSASSGSLRLKRTT